MNTIYIIKKNYNLRYDAIIVEPFFLYLLHVKLPMFRRPLIT